MILRTLVEEVTSFGSDLPDKRHKDMVAGLTLELTGLFSFFYAFWDEHYKLYQHSKTKQQYQLLLVTLTTVLAFINVTPLRYSICTLFFF